MSWSFMVPLGTFLAAVYIFKNSAEEISYLSACIAAVSLLATLVLAPWQLQCVLLLFILLSTRRQSLPSQSIEQPSFQAEAEAEAKKTTKFIYRGANYKPTSPTIESAEGEITEIVGKYRGQVCKVHTPVIPPVPQPTGLIKYRGIEVAESKQPPNHNK